MHASPADKMPAGIRYTKGVFATKASEKKTLDKEKIRIGVIVGKPHDPIKQAQARKLVKTWPEAFKVKNNTGPNAAGWGGQYQIDVAMGLTIGKLHPDVFAVDLIPGEEINTARLSKNHLNFNLCYDMVNATMSGDKKHIATVQKAFEDPSCRVWPEWDLQDFIYDKTRYMKACEKAGIPVIPSIYVMNGFNAKSVLKQVQQRGWDKFFIKPGRMGSFGLAAFKGKTDDCVKDASLLSDFNDKIDHDNYKIFLVQPYMTKPDGKVFDEVRNYFINGEWAYAVYTDGTDDDAVYPEPKGPRLNGTREMATRAYKEFLKVAKWRGEAFVPPLTRIDIGVIPVAGKGVGQSRMFVNEIEMEACTWLVRYCPWDLVERMGKVYAQKISELLAGLGRANEKIPNAATVKQLQAVLDERVYGMGQPKRKQEADTDHEAPRKWARTSGA